MLSMSALAENPDSLSSKTGISLRFRPEGVFVPFLIEPKNPLTVSTHPSSPCSEDRVTQNSRQNSLGSLRVSSFFFPNPKDDFRLVSNDGGGETGSGGATGHEGFLELRKDLDVEGEVPTKPGDDSGEEDIFPLFEA